MEAVFCDDCLEDVLRHHGKPEVFNSDQCSPFTRTAFTDVLKREGVVISMDGRGRAFDNLFVKRLWRSIKHEDVSLKGYASMGELLVGLAEYFAFYNGERPHQSLGHRMPDEVYRTAIGGGAAIIDKFPRAVEDTPCSATLHRGFLHRKGKIQSKTSKHNRRKTGAAPCGCE